MTCAVGTCRGACHGGGESGDGTSLHDVCGAQIIKVSLLLSVFCKLYVSLLCQCDNRSWCIDDMNPFLRFIDMDSLGTSCVFNSMCQSALVHMTSRIVKVLWLFVSIIQSGHSNRLVHSAQFVRVSLCCFCCFFW